MLVGGAFAARSATGVASYMSVVGEAIRECESYGAVDEAVEVSGGDLM
jgi:hypothetical protein